jgi:hypothetical protein
VILCHPSLREAGTRHRAQERKRAADARQGDANPPEPAEITRLGTGAMRPRISGPICRLRRPRRRLQRLHLERLPCLCSASNQCATGPKGPGRRARPASFGWDDGWSRPPCGVMGSLGRWRSGPIALGWGPESPCSIRRVKPLRNYPLVWRKKRQRVSLGMFAQRAVREARNADGGAALTPRHFASVRLRQRVSSSERGLLMTSGGT